MAIDKKELNFQLDEVNKIIMSVLENTNLHTLVQDNNSLLGSGKMLRSKLIQYLGITSNTDKEILSVAGAAVDIMHSASLIHDDVIDGGFLRRGNQTFWKKYGVNGAILFGDTLMFRSIALLTKQPRVDLLKELINMTGEVCCSEAEQELILRENSRSWDDCVKIARFKTGSLFAFAAVAGGTGDLEEADALRECGFNIGTAYQLADDVLDVYGNEEISGKTLGIDEKRGKTTAMTSFDTSSTDPIIHINNFINHAVELLSEWPNLQDSLNQYLEIEFNPIVSKFINM